MISLDAGHADPPLASLLEAWPELPRLDGMALDGAPTLFLRARAHSALPARLGHGTVYQQSFAPLADELRRLGLQPCQEAPNRCFAGVLLLPPRARAEARALWARASQYLAPGGRVMAAAANAEGARSAESDLAALLGLGGGISKHKCRVFWSAPWQGQVLVSSLLEAWQAFDTPCRIASAVAPGGFFWSRPGLFSWDRVDLASQLLVAHLPTDLAGRVADLGAGYGYLAAWVAEHCPQVTALDLYEAEALAEVPATHNLAAAVERAGRPLTWQFYWQDVSQGLQNRYQAIIANPPFHQPRSRAELPVLGQAFITAAADALIPDGRLYLVANRQLPYEAVLRRRFAQVRELALAEGFKVIEACRPG